MEYISIFLILLSAISLSHENYIIGQNYAKQNTDAARGNDLNEPVRVNKCCENNELYFGKSCNNYNNLTRRHAWIPKFTTADNKSALVRNYTFINGAPDCGSRQSWTIYDYENSSDRLRLLPNGVLRHYFDPPAGLKDENINENSLYFEYEHGKYCMDKKVEGNRQYVFAWVCAPEHQHDWTQTEFLMRNIISPTTHGLNIICFLAIAIIYFIMPTLRDLVGNIVTTICMCLILSQSGDIIRLLTVFKSHISLIITETICYVSLLGAFFWLNSLGYYVWRTFKARNVYLRITDGKKYCYYSGYAWSCTIILGVLAVFAHFTMDYPEFGEPMAATQEREEIGSLGMIIFFVPVAFTVLINVFFFSTTIKAINRLNTYGRIHHKLRHSFRMFLLLLLTMTITWLFFLSSFSKYDGLVNCYIIVNAFQGPIILYVCVFNQKHVSYLIKKTCCYTNCFCACCRPDPEMEWGDEMTAMHNGNY